MKLTQNQSKKRKNLQYGDGNETRDRGIYEQAGKRHILTVFSEPKVRAQNLRFKIYQWKQGQEIMAAPENPKIVAPGMHKEAVKR